MKYLVLLVFLLTSLGTMAEEQEVKQRTYFIGGALFSGEKDNKASFSQVLIKSLKKIVDEDFKIVESSIRRAGMGVFCLNRGLKPIEKPEKHRIVGDVIKEVMEDYQGQKNEGPGNINLIGSSYGSVVASQTALYLLANLGKETKYGYLHPETKITLTLSANAVDYKSPLFQKLLEYQNNKHIIFSLTDLSDPNDPLVGAVGSSRKEMRKNVLALLKLLKAKGIDSVFGMHLKGMNDMGRVEKIINNVLVINHGHGDKIATKALAYLQNGEVKNLSFQIKSDAEKARIKFLEDKGFKSHILD